MSLMNLALAAAAGLATTTPTVTLAQSAPDRPSSARMDWRQAEADILSGHTQLTFAEDFVKAGEAYFSADGERIIFQAVPIPPEGEEPSPHYSMYVADLERDGSGRVTGIGAPTRLSPDGSANTCGWFHPDDTSRVLFGSTLVEPSEDDQPGYQRGTGRYAWQFPTEMEIVTTTIEHPSPKPLFKTPGYTAEGSWSPDGRSVLYAQVDTERSKKLGRPDADLYIYDTGSGDHTPLVTEEGYDGGPFFSRDGEWICYRSDRRGDNLLQLFIAKLARDDDGRITGIEREVQVTNNQHVNWAPYWDPTGRYLIYTTSEVAHFNYEVFAVEVFGADGGLLRLTTPVRVTNAMGFDGLPVFSPDGDMMMWTAQRNADESGSPSSQLWIADVDRDAIERKLTTARMGGMAPAPSEQN